MLLLMTQTLVGDVCQKFAQVCILEGRAVEAILPLRTAAYRMGSATSSLTPVHPEFLQVISWVDYSQNVVAVKIPVFRSLQTPIKDIRTIIVSEARAHNCRRKKCV